MNTFIDIIVTLCLFAICLISVNAIATWFNYTFWKIVLSIEEPGQNEYSMHDKPKHCPVQLYKKHIQKMRKAHSEAVFAEHQNVA